MRASGKGAADGQVVVSLDGRSELVVSDLDNDRQKVESVWLGNVSGSSGANGGAIRFDGYESSP